LTVIDYNLNRSVAMRSSGVATGGCTPRDSEGLQLRLGGLLRFTGRRSGFRKAGIGYGSRDVMVPGKMMRYPLCDLC